MVPGNGVMLMDRPGETTHFGFREVPLGDKQTLVNDVFRSVASRYDLMNDLMSGGLHRVWKNLMINALDPPRGDAPFALLDVAGGTGDIAFRAAKAAGAGFRATVCDINSEMLAVGRERAVGAERRAGAGLPPPLRKQNPGVPGAGRGAPGGATSPGRVLFRERKPKT